MRILYAGTPEIALPGLSLLAGEHEVVGVLTNPDRGSGRGRKVRRSPVKERALELDLPLLQPERLNSEARDGVAALRPELLVTAAYGKIFGPKFLALFSRGGINMHPSLLPRHRGPTPIPAAILAGDKKTGITVQELALEMDAGDILLQEERSLNGRETTGELTAWAAEAGGRMLLEAVNRIESGRVRGRPQDPDKVTYCSFLSKEKSWIEWGVSAEEIDRLVRAYNPWPLARTTYRGESLIVHESLPVSTERRSAAGENDPVAELLKAYEAGPGEGRPPEAGRVFGVDKDFGILVQTGGGALGIARLQAPARKPLPWDAFLNGNPEVMSALLGASKESDER